jgi:hypothetical protein
MSSEAQVPETPVTVVRPGKTLSEGLLNEKVRSGCAAQNYVRNLNVWKGNLLKGHNDRASVDRVALKMRGRRRSDALIVARAALHCARDHHTTMMLT